MHLLIKRLAIAIVIVIPVTGLTTMAHAQTSQPSADVRTLAADTDAFAVGLYSRLRDDKGNLFFSPYSIESALAMVYGGARGETADQMARVLHFSVPPAQLHPAAGQL